MAPDHWRRNLHRYSKRQMENVDLHNPPTCRAKAADTKITRSDIEVHVLTRCGSAYVDASKTLLVYMLESFRARNDPLPGMIWILQQDVNINAMT